MNEALEKEDNKKLFRELVKKYHPDNKVSGNEEIMKKLNKAKDDGDLALETFYASYLNKPRPKEEERKLKRPAHFKTDEDWFKWHDKVKGKREKKQDKMRREK